MSLVCKTMVFNFVNRMPSIHLLIEGKVQGVFYRASAKEIALALGLTSWVRNTEEGHVEAVASGTDSALQKFVDLCNKGPEKAIVTNVQITQMEEETFKSFQIRRD